MIALPREVESAVQALCEDLATPISLGVFLRLKYGEYDQLASLTVDPADYLTWRAFYNDNVAVCMLKKYPDLPTTIDRRSVAVSNFWASEKACCSTNVRLQRLFGQGQLQPSDLACIDLLDRARKIVAHVLGPCPDLLQGRFGPGATYGDRGRLTTVPDKMSSRPTLTSAALPFLFQWTGTAWASACASADKPPEFIRGNRFTTVPKDSTKDRGICIEPSINVFYQLGLGRVIRRRLRLVGIDLDRAQGVHKRVACEASIRGHLATIDLSNASDTVSKVLVRHLLPWGWYSMLSALRSPFSTVDGKPVNLEKFSSMGNGFTFELETLIFLSISLAVLSMRRDIPIERMARGLNAHSCDVYVFGDDIIVPSDIASDVVAALRFCGFEPNRKKTFLQGNFRESCGGDYFNGRDVRPYYLKFSPKEPHEYIAFANGLRRLTHKADLRGRIDPFHLRAWFRVLDALPSHVRSSRGPEDLGDLVIHDEADRWSTRWRHGIRYFKTWSPVKHRRVDWKYFRPDVVLASAVYGSGDGLLGVTPRNSVLGYAHSWVPYS